MKKLTFLLLFPLTIQAATFQFNWGAGFNDTTVVTPVGGNTGTTLGDQRKILFQAAGDIWGAILQSDVPIVVNAQFSDLTCNPNSAVLGSAGPISIFSFPSIPIPNTYYPLSLANAIRGVDNSTSNPDISANFNSAIDTGCFNGGTFYYGINGDAPPGKVQLFSTVLHEFGHGLGFVSFADLNNGSFPMNGFTSIPTIFDRFIFDNQANLEWTAMSSADRLASMTNDPNVIWNGNNVTNESIGLLTGGLNAGKVRLHAPASIQPGSSISHFSSAAFPDLLMEPQLGNINFDQVDLTPALFKDIGYQLNSSNIIIFANGFE